MTYLIRSSYPEYIRNFYKSVTNNNPINKWTNKLKGTFIPNLYNHVLYSIIQKNQIFKQPKYPFLHE